MLPEGYREILADKQSREWGSQHTVSKFAKFLGCFSVIGYIIYGGCFIYSFAVSRRQEVLYSVMLCVGGFSYNVRTVNFKSILSLYPVIVEWE
jgi:hypothetical protein